MTIMRINVILSVILLFLLSGAIESSAADQSICSDDSYVSLYDSGSLKRCVLKDSYDVNSITCKDSMAVSFYDNGSLESCTLASTATVGSTKCLSDREIFFYSNGSLRRCVKYED